MPSGDGNFATKPPTFLFYTLETDHNFHSRSLCPPHPPTVVCGQGSALIDSYQEHYAQVTASLALGQSNPIHLKSLGQVGGKKDASFGLSDWPM